MHFPHDLPHKMPGLTWDGMPLYTAGMRCTPDPGEVYQLTFFAKWDRAGYLAWSNPWLEVDSNLNTADMAC